MVVWWVLADGGSAGIVFASLVLYLKHRVCSAGGGAVVWGVVRVARDVGFITICCCSVIWY